MTDADIRDVLQSTRVIAMVGWSPKAERPSHGVAQFLRAMGCRVIPVNPGVAGQMIEGEMVYADLAAIPADAGVDMVDIFRASDAVPGIVEQALALPDLRSIWMQIGVVHDGAALMAQRAGKAVIMDRCPKIEWVRLGVAPQVRA